MTYTYELKPHQKQILNDVKRLPRKNLHCLVAQSSLKDPNLTLNEFKKHIKRGIRLYIKEHFGPDYYSGLENEKVKYFCFFETSKDWFWSQHSSFINEEGVDLKFHFHLFISSDYGMISFPDLIHSIYSQLTSQRNKRLCIGKFGYNRIKKLEDDFILYHTKQQMFHNSLELVLKNI